MSMRISWRVFSPPRADLPNALRPLGSLPPPAGRKVAWVALNAVALGVAGEEPPLAAGELAAGLLLGAYPSGGTGDRRGGNCPHRGYAAQARPLVGDGGGG
ncbi:Uncharacterized protein ChrSV_1912 [Chromobacterium vaccinii]|nr:Uncharacterized protein ChrSW_1912 [Chromobacterium vaccinii]QND89370.1 Uncharacterized protein ChrSV_1912 [Chromobacterium vaccinii]